MTFRIQSCMGITFVLLGVIGTGIFDIEILYNVGWILCGMLFLLHPVYPKHISVGRKGLFYMRMGGAILVILGIATKFDL